MIGVRAWRRRESVFDVIEFDGKAWWTRAPIGALVLIAVAFLVLMVINDS